MVTFKEYLNEAKSEMDRLKKNKKPLTDEERELCMKKKATWHHGNQGQPSPAVWKSVDTKGKETFVTNTHRAYKTANNIGDAIDHYHNGIKQTA